jgi:high-affinity K+ transport system ATPase subunit B
MIMVSGSIDVRPGTREAFLTRSGEAVAPARRSWGCRDFVVAAHPIESNRVNVYEEWESKEALIALRGDGPGDDLSSSIVKADVAKHMVASSEPASPAEQSSGGRLP